MTDQKKLWLFLVCEAVAFAIVMAAFKYIQPKLFAGAVGGFLFLVLGVLIVIQCWRSSWLKRRPTFYAGLAHLFLTSLPLTITRFANYSMDFADVRVLGLPGPVFHELSSAVYLALILATVFDLVMNHRLTKSIR